MIPRSILTTVLLAPLAVAAEKPLDFSRDVLPILSDACFHCHGPDEKGRKAELRLDTKEGAYRTKDGITVVAPGKSADSDLVSRIFSDDKDEVMPPPKAARFLTEPEKAVLKRWVDEGAKWGKHWSHEAMSRPVPPAVQGAAWARNDVDRFILARLEAEHLSPAPPADAATLCRRMTFDLTGLPPTPGEVETFAAEHARDAQAATLALARRLLASPRYGERMAADWLDAARFADTNGYQADATREMWPWRDWVIRSFNENLPFDKFGTWQIAGDLLPNATQEQKLATAFNRLHSMNEEGGVVDEEFRVAYVVDRVNTYGTIFLAHTFECSRCHDHKYDPIPTRDFYQLFAFFQNVDEAGQIPFNGFNHDMPEPVLLLTTPEQDKALAELRAKISTAGRQLAEEQEKARTAFAAWLPQRGPLPAVPAPVSAFSFEKIEGGKTPNAVEKAPSLKSHERPEVVAGKFGQAAQLDGEDGFEAQGVGAFHSAQPFAFSVWLRPGAPQPRAVVFHKSKAPADAASRGYELLLENGKPVFAINHYWPGNALRVAAPTPLAPDAWTHVAISYDGSSRAAGVRIWLNGQPAALETRSDNLTKDFALGAAEQDFQIGYRFRDNGYKGGALDELQVFDQALTAVEVAQLAGQPVKEWSGGQPGAALFEHFLARVHPPAIAARANLAAARDELRKLISPITEISVMKELPQPKPAYILTRGSYDSHGAAVTANTPSAFPPMSAEVPRNRLGLAQWTFDPEHPITARVTVNRLWQMVFGRGLVESTDNFGSQGAQPTHPELLDWLARRFIASGWDQKALLELLVTSATYAQSSKTSADLLARDPANDLLARGPSRRLAAEMLRDQALATSGLLVEKIGGRSVKPYQPAGVWDVASGKPVYKPGTGADLYRRSLYSFWKRTVPPPTMMTFDAADRANCTVKRQTTSTPLQALVLLNDPQILEAARVLAERSLTEGGNTPAEQVAWLYRAVLARTPQERELAVLQRLLDEQTAIFAGDEKAAGELNKVGERKSAAGLSAVAVAARTVVAKTLLNSDRAVMRR